VDIFILLELLESAEQKSLSTMNFVKPDAIASVAAAHGLSPRVTDADAAKFNAFVFGVLRTALDAARLSACKATLQASDFDTVARLQALLAQPMGRPGAAAADPVAIRTPQRGGHAGTVMPLGYYDPLQVGSGYVDDPQGTLVTEQLFDVARHPLVSTFPSGTAGFQNPLQCGGGGWLGESGHAARPQLSATFQTQLGGSPARTWLTDEVLQRMLKEYHSRRSKAIKLSDGAKARLRAIVELNLNRALAAARKGGRRPTVSCLGKASGSWVLCLS
jgi:type II secretory pathway pseudopilin PulG